MGGVVDAISNAVSSAFDTASNVISGGIDAISNAVTNPMGFMRGLGGIADSVIKFSIKPIEGLLNGGVKGYGKGLYEGTYGVFKAVGPFAQEYIPGFQDNNPFGSMWKRNVVDNPEMMSYIFVKVGLTIASVALSLTGNVWASVALSIASYAISPGINEAFIEKLKEKYAAKQNYEAYIRDTWSNDLFSGDIYLWLAGGALYNECYAGGLLCNPLGLLDPSARGLGYGQEVDTSMLMTLQMPYEDAAGGDLWRSYLAGNSSTVDVLGWGKNK